MTTPSLITSPYLSAAVRQQMAEDAAARSTAAANSMARGRTGGEVAGDVGLQLLQGAVGVGQALYGAGNIATLGVMDRLLGMSTNFDETNRTIESWKSDPTQAAKARASEAFDSSVWEGVKEYATTPSLLQDLIVPNIASLIPAGAGAQFASRTAQGAGAIAKHATRGAAIAGGIQAGGAADVDTINAARAAGMTEGEAQAAGLGAGVATGVMTPVVSMVTGGAQLKGAVAARLLGRTQAAAATGRGVVKAALGGVAKEAGEESIQSGLETVIQNVATGEDAMAGAAQSAVLGGLAGGVLGGGMGVYAGPRKATPLRSTVSAEVKASAEAAGVPAAASGLAPTVAESQQVSDALAAVQPKEGDPLDVQRAIDYRMSAKLAGMKEKDLISTEELVKSQLFTEQPDGTLTRWNSDLQRNEEVPKEQVDAAVKAATSWKEFAVKDLGLRPSDLQGKAWKAFTDAANGAGVMPISETVGDFLASYAGGITPGAELTKFDTRLSEKYAPPVDDVPVAVPPPPVRNPLDVQRAIDYRMSAKLAGTRERDLLSVEELAKRQLFTEQPDGTLTRWNSDLQRNEEVPKEQVDAAVKAATSWKEFAVKDLGLRPSDLQGKAWKEFTDAAKAADVVPISDAAGEFLSAYAGGVDPGANLSKFAMRLSEKYSPAVEDIPVTATTPPVLTSEAARAIAAMRKNKKEPVVVDVTPAKGDWNDAGGVTTLHYGGDGGVFGDSGASEFTMGRMDKDDHTYVDGGNTVSFYKDPETDLWHWQNKGVGAFGVFDAPTRADAKRSIEMVVDERAASWDAMRAAQGMTDLNEGITRNKFVEEQFDEELDSAMRLAAEDEDETAHGAFLDHVQQTFDSTGATEALRKTKDYAIAKAKEKFGSGDDALTPAGLNKLVGDIAQSYIDRHDNIVSKIGGNSVYVDDAVFSRTGAKDGTPTHATLPMMHMEQVQRVVDFANTSRSNTETPAQVFPTVQAFLDAHDMQGVPADTKGVYLGDGTVALVAENIKDAEDAARTILHERTHEGLSGLLGDNLSVVTNRLWANAAMRTRIKGKMEELGLSRSVAAEEVLTDMQQNNERLTRDVWSKVKTGVKKAFDVLLGSDQIVVSDADVDSLLDDVVKYRAKGVSTPSSRMTSAEAMKHVDNMMDGVPDTVNAARFSRALEELEKITGDSDEAPAESTSSILSGVAKDTTKYVGGLMSALRKGNFGTLPRQLYRVVGVPQLHKTFRSMWDATTEDGDKDNAYDRFAGHFSDHTDERNRVQHSVGNITRELDSMRRSKPAMAKKFNALVQYSTFFQINPGNEVQPDAPGIDAEERSKAQAMIGSLWKQVGAEGQKLFGDMQAAYSRVIRDEYAAVKQTLADAKGINLDTASALELSKFNEEFGGMLDAQLRLVGRFPYSPLKRFGKFMVDIRDGEGKQVEFTGHDTEAEALKFASDQRARFGSALTVSTMLRSEFRMDMDGLNHNMLEKIRAGVALMYPESAVLKTMSADEQAEVEDRNERYEEMRGVTERVLVDVYLRSIPDHSIMNRLNARKYVAGFPLDASRAFNSYMIGAAGHIANVKYSAAMSRDLSDMAAVVRQKGLGNDDGIKMMNVLNAVRGQYSGRKDVEPNPIASMLTTASFVWMMSSPSQMIVNALQTPLVAAPRMFAQFGVKGTIDSLSSAAAQWFKTGGILGDPSINPMVKKVLEEMQQTGMEDFTLASTMSGLAAGQSSDMHTAWRTILKVASYGMHKSEVFNRQITAHAYATQMLKKNPSASYDELLASTKDFIDTQSHFNYDPQNSPEVMQGPWRKAILQFQNYRLNMLALLARDIKTAEFGRMLTGKDALDPETAKLARATLAYTVGTQLALTGAAGTVVAPAVFAIMDAFRDDDDLLDSRTAFVQAAPRILAHGALSVLPLLNIDPSRVDTGGILPILGDRHYAPKDKSAAEEFDYHAVKMLGPSVALAKRMWDGSRDIYNGDFKEALKKMLPGPLVSVYTAAVDFDGMRDKRGVQFYDPTLADTIKTAIGLKSGDILAANEKRSAAYQAETHVSALSKRALTKVALGYNLGDSDLQQEGTDQFMGLVNAYPGMVNAKMLRRTIAGATKAQYNADMYGVSKAGKLSQEVLAAIGE